MAAALRSCRRLDVESEGQNAKCAHVPSLLCHERFNEAGLPAHVPINLHNPPNVRACSRRHSCSGGPHMPPAIVAVVPARHDADSEGRSSAAGHDDSDGEAEQPARF